MGSMEKLKGELTITFSSTGAKLLAMAASLAGVTTPASMVQAVPEDATVMSPLSPSVSGIVTATSLVLTVMPVPAPTTRIAVPPPVRPAPEALVSNSVALLLAVAVMAPVSAAR